MKRQIEIRLLLAAVFVISVFVLSGCYTQLAKPQSERVEPAERDYYVQDYSEEEKVAEDAEYAESDEALNEDQEVHITREIYHDVHYYGYNHHSWVYDPFFDPYFYDTYSPYSSHVSVHIGYYDPFFYGSYYYRDPFFYGGVYACDPFWYFGSSSYYFGYDRRPYRSYVPYYYPGYSGGVVNTIPVKKRGFTRRGARRADDFGYEPGHVVNNRGTSRATNSGLAKSGYSDPVSSRRGKIKRTTSTGSRIGRRGNRTNSEQATKAEQTKSRRRKRYSNSDVAYNPDAKAITKGKSSGNSGRKTVKSRPKRRERSRISRRSGSKNASHAQVSSIKRSNSVRSKKEAKVRSKSSSTSRSSNVRSVSQRPSSGSKSIKSSGTRTRSSGARVSRGSSSGSVRKSSPPSSSKSSSSSGRRRRK